MIKCELNLTEVYQDALQPSVRQIGGILGDLTKTVKLLTAPLSLCGIANDRFQKWCNRIRNDVEEENMQEAQANILVPTLNGLAINPDETLLGEMFYNILKNSIDKTKQKILNPAFPKILEQLSQEEARILIVLKYHSYIDCSYFMKQNSILIYNEENIEVSHNLNKDFFMLHKNHLMFLGLLTSTFYRDTEAYFNVGGELILQNSAQGKEIIQKQENDKYKFEVKYFSRIALNDFGKAFVDICITDKCKEFVDFESLH